MTKLRTQVPFNQGYISSNTGIDDWADRRFYPDPPYGEYGSDDFPTVNVHQSGTLSSMTRKVVFSDGSQYNLPNADGCSANNQGVFWNHTQASGSYEVIHRKGRGANWIYGHKGPASNGSVIKSFQRNVIGLGWQWESGNSVSAGISPHNIILLYRDKAYTDRFHGAWLIRDGEFLPETTTQSYGSKIFDDIPGYAAKRHGKVHLSMLADPRSTPGRPEGNYHPEYQKVTSGDLVFQGIWFDYRTNDTSSSDQTAPYKMYNVRLSYQWAPNYEQPDAPRDFTQRIVLPRLWRFDHAYDRSKPLKLT